MSMRAIINSKPDKQTNVFQLLKQIEFRLYVFTGGLQKFVTKCVHNVSRKCKKRNTFLSIRKS